MKGIIIVVVFIALVCGVAGRIRRAEPTLEQILTTNHTGFVRLLNLANPNLFNEIKAATLANPITLFVPIDAAINKTSAVKNLTDTLNYHAHRGDVGPDVLKNFNTLPTLYVSPELLAPQVLSFGAMNSSIYINRQARILTEVVASNGVVHVIDAVLNIPYEDVIRAANTGSFSHLQELVKIANFTDPDTTKNVTLLAPTDIAFTTLFTAQPVLQAYFTNNKLPSVKATIQNLLTKHLLKGTFYPNTLKNGTTVFDSSFGTETVNVDKNLNNITVRLSQATATVATVTIPNLLAADGVAHGIDQVLTVPGFGLLDLHDTLYTLNASNYLARLNATGLSYLLTETTPHTFFVPKDDVKGVTSLNHSDILYGIAEIANVTFPNRHTGSLLNLPSLDGHPQQLYLEYSFINNVTKSNKVNGIIAAGPPAITKSGSYVYTINTVLTIPGVPENVLNAAGPNNFTAFLSLYQQETLINNTGLYNINSNNLTLFVPTNEAFAKLPLGVVGYLRMDSNKQLASELLNSHIVDNNALYDLKAGSYVTANANSITIQENKGNYTIKYNKGLTANVSPVPLLTNNGAAFAVDEVLVPTGLALTAKEILQGLAHEKTTGDSIGKYDYSLTHFEQAGLEGILENTKQNFTLFVYTDSAWDNAAQGFSTTPGENITHEEAEQLNELISYGIVYGDSALELNKSNVLVPGIKSNSTITVTQAGADEKTKVTLVTPQGKYEATVVVSTVTGYGQAIYGLDRVLGIDTKDTSKSSKLPTWAWVVIIIGGILIGLLILALIVGAAWYLFVRPNREGYRHIN